MEAPTVPPVDKEALPLAEVEKLVEPGPMVSVGFLLKELRSVQDRGA
jgi:hypothetical protein